MEGVACLQLTIAKVEGKAVTTIEGLTDREKKVYSWLRRSGGSAVRFLHAGNGD